MRLHFYLQSLTFEKGHFRGEKGNRSNIFLPVYSSYLAYHGSDVTEHISEEVTDYYWTCFIPNFPLCIHTLYGKLISFWNILWNIHTLLTIPHIFPMYLIRNVIFYWTTFLKCSYLTYHHSYLFETPNSYFFEYSPLYIHILLNLVHTLLNTVHTLLTIVHTLLWYQIIIPYLS